MSDQVFTVEGVLASGVEMDKFIHVLCAYKLDNLTGGAFREVRLCYGRRGVLLLSRHSGNSDCSILITSAPDVGFRRGCTDSRAYGNPMPTAADGNALVSVWQRGAWTKEGPWVQTIKEVVEEAISRLESARETERKEKEREQRTKAETASEQQQALVDAWTI